MVHPTAPLEKRDATLRFAVFDKTPGAPFEDAVRQHADHWVPQHFGTGPKSLRRRYFMGA